MPFFRFGGAYRPCQQLGESGPLEDVVPEYEAYGIVADKFLADQERLREPVGRRLFGIREMYPIIGSVAQQPPERGQVTGGGDHQDLPDSGQHQNRQRIVDHRLVVDREQLLGNSLRDRVQPRTRTTGQYNAFHRVLFGMNLYIVRNAIRSVLPSRFLLSYPAS